MEYLAFLRFIHILSFAAWFGTILASLFLLKALEPRLTGNSPTASEDAELLRKFIKIETKAADIAFIGAVLSGILLTWSFHGWTAWLGVKTGLIVLQVALTMGYIVRKVRPLAYPCSAEAYRSWYRLFGISLSMFILILYVTFFLL